MRTARMWGLAFCVLAMPLIGCGGGEGAERGAEGSHAEGPLKPEDVAAAKQLLAQLQAANYLSFARAPGWSARRAGSTQHHGAYLDVYVNSALSQAVSANATEPWPIGSIIVKDGWSDSAGSQAFMTSVGRKDGTGSWFGAEFSASGEVLSAGTNFAECQMCHAPAKDFTLSF